MSRYSYLWGTKGKDYTEIGRSEKLDHFLRVEVGAQNTGLVLEEVMKMIKLICMYGPIFFSVIIIVLCLLYKLDKIYPQVMADLAERDRQGIL